MVLCALAGSAREGLWYGWLCALLLLPNWKETRLIGAMECDLRTVAALTAGAGFLLSPQPKGSGLRRWTLCDTLVGLMIRVDDCL